MQYPVAHGANCVLTVSEVVLVQLAVVGFVVVVVLLELSVDLHMDLAGSVA